MYIIDNTYFIEDKLIPNINGSGGIGSNKPNIDSLVDNEVHSLLESILGYVSYKDLVDNLNTDGSEKPTTTQKWKDLINGKEYIKNEKTYYFKGLKYQVGVSKNSLLAYYVFYKWIKQNISQQSSTGSEIVLTPKNAINVGLTSKLVSTWNKFWSLLGEGYSHRGVRYKHCGVPIYDYYGSRRDSNVSLFQFLTDNKEIYGELPLQLPITEDYYGYKNQLGL